MTAAIDLAKAVLAMHAADEDYGCGFYNHGPWLKPYNRSKELAEVVLAEGKAKKRDLDEAIALLRKVEWSWNYDAEMASCEVCLGSELNGHKPDCPLAAFLARFP